MRNTICTEARWVGGGSLRRGYFGPEEIPGEYRGAAMRITCPICGERDRREFYYQGAALALDRPDAGCG